MRKIKEKRMHKNFGLILWEEIFLFFRLYRSIK